MSQPQYSNGCQFWIDEAQTGVHISSKTVTFVAKYILQPSVSTFNILHFCYLAQFGITRLEDRKSKYKIWL